jgi:uncharacterized cupin superfamily protein
VIDGPHASVVAGGDQFWERLASGENTTMTDSSWLVGTYLYDASWSNWEMHPDGDEVVTRHGHIDLIVEVDGHPTTWSAPAGTTVVIPAGAWHTADVHAPARAMHVTFGANTQGRARTAQTAT